jgi:tetratricopeptide (TPR) repeat protein
MKMRTTKHSWLAASALAGTLVLGVQIAAAQAQSGTQNPPAQSQPDKSKPADPAPLSMDNQQQPPAASADEEAAFKAFAQVPGNDVNKKIQAAEEFLQKYPQSRYRPAMYQALVSGYFATQQVPKLVDAGEKEIALNPNDAPVLAVVAQTLARSFNAQMPDAEQRLEKAEQYSKRAIEVVPTLPKPANLTDEAFTVAKNDTLEMAHSGLGLVYIRRAKYAEAIPELEASIKTDPHPDPDPVNLYLLGMANDRTSHFDAAAAAFNRCASIQSSLQATCKSGAEEAKKQGSSQLSAPN